jgi:hypothetical protein
MFHRFSLRILDNVDEGAARTDATEFPMAVLQERSKEVNLEAKGLVQSALAPVGPMQFLSRLNSMRFVKVVD